MKDGGQAFPFKNAGGWSNGLTVRQYYAAYAPDSEIADLVPEKIAACAAIVGIPESEYNAFQHYYTLIHILRGKWADARIAEDAAHAAKEGA